MHDYAMLDIIWGIGFMVEGIKGVIEDYLALIQAEVKDRD
jgi:hypothetical protein